MWERNADTFYFRKKCGNKTSTIGNLKCILLRINRQL